MRLPLLAVGAHDEPKPEPCWDGSYMLLPLRSDAGGDEAGTLRGPDRVLFSALPLRPRGLQLRADRGDDALRAGGMRAQFLVCSAWLSSSR